MVKPVRTDFMMFRVNALARETLSRGVRGGDVALPVSPLSTTFALKGASLGAPTDGVQIKFSLGGTHLTHLEFSSARLGQLLSSGV